MDDALVHLTAQELEEVGLLDEAVRQAEADLAECLEVHRVALAQYQVAAERHEGLIRYQSRRRRELEAEAELERQRQSRVAGVTAAEATEALRRAARRLTHTQPRGAQ